jgi:polyvinyl alcohol dehydrogenase (cytochrome)
MMRSARKACRRVALLGGVTSVCFGLATAGSAASIGPTDWPAFLGGPQHTSRSADPAITTANAPSLTQKWHFKIPYLSSPVVADGSIFIGSYSGNFYKISELGGGLQAKRFLGFQPKLTCAPFGFASTATVAVDPNTRKDTVYVTAPDGYLYALDPTNLKTVWRTPVAIPSKKVNDFLNWSSPTVVNGKVYVGISANCDTPLVRGGVAEYNQGTGRRIGTFYTVAKGHVGGSVWSTVAVDGSGDVYVSTGNPVPGAKKFGNTDSILKLSPALKLLDAFHVPNRELRGDSDFGGSPTLFSASVKGKQTLMVGACNKNGIFYALRRSNMSLIWQRKIGSRAREGVRAQCQSAPAFDGRFLYMAGPATTIGSKAFRGSVERLNPATGAITWKTGLPNGVITSPTINVSGVVGLGTYDNTSTLNRTYLVNAATGAILRKLNPGSDFAQTVFADGRVFTASSTGLYAWGP